MALCRRISEARRTQPLQQRQAPRRARQERGPCEVRRGDRTRRAREAPQGSHEPSRQTGRRAEITAAELARRRAICSDCDHWNDTDPPICDLIIRGQTSAGVLIPEPARRPAPCAYEARLRRAMDGCPLGKFSTQRCENASRRSRNR